MTQATGADPAVDVVGVTKRYGSLVAVDDVSVRVAPGEVYGILGPNGAGKTTLLRMLFGLIRPDSGTIRRVRPQLARGTTCAPSTTSPASSRARSSTPT